MADLVSDVVEFVQARIAEREALTLAIQDQIGPDQNGSMVLTGEFGSLIYRYIDLDGALADVAAKRMLLESSCRQLDDAAKLERLGADGADVLVIRAPAEWQISVLASAYAGHTDYREEWRL